MRRYDIVYILKQNVRPEEIRYSLRSIEKNFTYKDVWFYCGKPEGITPDHYVPHRQDGATKWQRARSSLIQICKNDEISDKFWLFNDDFYILQRVTKETQYHRGLLKDHYLDVEKRHNGHTAYTNQLRACEEQLKDAGLTTLDYALHVPILVDKKKMLETLKMFPRCPMFRSLYGNYAGIGGEYHEDHKIAAPTGKPRDGEMFLSSSDKGFPAVKDYLDQLFPDPCKYEDNEDESEE